jgi:CheY-like chemotaxis protein
MPFDRIACTNNCTVEIVPFDLCGIGMAHFPKGSRKRADAARTDVLTVLWVEDDDAYRYAVKRHFEAAGFDVLDAPDFSEALKVIESDRAISLLLADIRLPKDTPHGFSIARMARMRRPGLPVLFVTAYEVPPNESGMSDAKILSKTLSMDMLLLEVQEALGAAAA